MHSVRIAGTAVVVGIAIAVIAVLTLLGHFHVSFASASKSEDATLKAKRRPVEFLYLDGGRVLTYLEEIQGGNITSEEQSRRRTQALSDKLAVQDTLEHGSSSEQEEIVQRSVSPTAASSYFELVKDLEAGDQIKRIKWFHYPGIENLEEGQFVQFHTRAMRPPIYLDPYLAVRQDPTLAALFPRPARGLAGSQRVIEERHAAKRFSRQVGGDPRIVFSLRSKVRGCPPAKQPARRTSESSALFLNSLQSTAVQVRCEYGKRHLSVQFLLPLRYRQLTDEGSLIQDGGGEINVLGKIVRILPEYSYKKIAYIDSPTRQTWRRPLHQAVRVLLCRSDPACERKAREEKDGGTAVGEAPRDARRNMEKALINQTEIHKDGAVVVPLAIYK